MVRKTLRIISGILLIISCTVSIISFCYYLKINSNAYDLTSNNYSPEQKLIAQQELGEYRNSIIDLSLVTTISTCLCAISFASSFAFKGNKPGEINKKYK